MSSFFRDLFKNEPVRTGQTTSLPGWATAAGEDLWRRGSDAQKPFEGYGSNPYGGTSDDARTAFQGFRDQMNWMQGDGANFFKGLMDRDPMKVSTEGTFDAGDISKYMSPYVDNAMQPALAKISEAANAARGRVKSQATGAGSFGDARHGIAENAVNQNESQAIGDTASQFMQQAFNQAVATKQGDLGRKFQADQFNAGQDRQDIATKAGLMGQQQGMMNNLLGQLFQGGQYQDARDTQAGTFDYNEFLRGQGWDQQQIGFLSQLLGSLPMNRTSTTTQEGGTGPGWGLAGGALAGLFSRI